MLWFIPFFLANSTVSRTTEQSEVVSGQYQKKQEREKGGKGRARKDVGLSFLPCSSLAPTASLRPLVSLFSGGAAGGNVREWHKEPVRPFLFFHLSPLQTVACHHSPVFSDRSNPVHNTYRCVRCEEARLDTSVDEGQEGGKDLERAASLFLDHCSRLFCMIGSQSSI